MQVFLRLLLGAVFLVCAASGCGPSISEEELGTVIYDVAQLPNTDETYPRPKSPYDDMGEEVAHDHDAHDHDDHEHDDHEHESTPSAPSPPP
ncbi:MAG: hypothetical protein HQ582_15240 [Planctomycetes bacterium]|nr:hypothetical protein [Planctomycetota bacterium]